MDLRKALKLKYSYDKEEGFFINRKSLKPVGMGDPKLSSLTVKHLVFCGIRYRASKLIYLYHHGILPDKPPTHLDGDRTNDRIENLSLNITQDQAAVCKHVYAIWLRPEYREWLRAAPNTTQKIDNILTDARVEGISIEAVQSYISAPGKVLYSVRIRPEYLEWLHTFKPITAAVDIILTAAILKG